ncbi:MAG: hypothetical protein C5B58_13690 [Acidobacteria bacterium]|nr:MAG: hypothetical protein C5B58_13690 [Acidobacteriota bacterium]
MTDTATDTAPPSEAAPDPITANAEFGEPIRASTEEATIRQSVSELNKKREQEGTLGDPGEPLERKWGTDGPVKLRDAGRAFSEVHKLESGREHLASLSEAERRQIAALGSDPDSDQFALEVGDLAAQLGKKPSELPMSQVGVAGNSGKVHAPIDDMSPIIGDRATTQPATGNLREVTRGLSNFRQAVEAQKQAILDEFAAQQQANQLAPEQTAAPQEPPRQQAPQEPAQQTTRQPDPLAIERQNLAWQRQVNAELAQLSAGEAQAWASLNNLETQWKSIPEVRDPKLQRETYLRNPERHAEIELARQQYEAAKAAHVRDFQIHRQARVTRQSELADFQRKQNDAAVTAYNRAEDDKFQKQFAREYPGQNVRELSGYVMQALRKSGVDEGRITQLWQSGALRGVETQMLLARAGMFEMAQAKSKNITSKKVAVPPVQRPGIARPRGADDDASIARLERELATVTGDKAVKAAMRLTQARRSAGRL